MNQFLEQIIRIAHQNKYTAWYVAIITRALERTDTNEGYVERHHILPRSFNMGGEKDERNIVKLTAREHFVCHALLVKMFSNHLMHKMGKALHNMRPDPTGKRYFNARLYELKRGKMSHTEETKKKMSIIRTGTKATDSTKATMSMSQVVRHREKPFTEETKELLRKKNIGGNNPVALPVIIEGINYSSRQEAKCALGISLKNIDKIATGKCKTVQEAVTRKTHQITKPLGGNSTKSKQIIYNGIVYTSIRSAATKNNMTYTQFRRLLKPQSC